jgi:hypothetical protein
MRVIFSARNRQNKHINKSIIRAAVNMYRSDCLVVSGEKEGKGNF